LYTQLISNFDQRVKHARSDAAHLATLRGNGIWMHGGQIDDDTLKPLEQFLPRLAVAWLCVPSVEMFTDFL